MLEPLQFEFFVRALLGVSLIALLCGVVGCFVVLRGLSYIGDAIAHAVFPGLVGAFLLKLDYYLGGLVAAVLTAFGIGWVVQKGGLKQDAAIGTVFVGMFALGVVMLSKTQTYSVDLAHLLVGDPLGISTTDILMTALVSTLILLALFLLRKELLLVAFDPIEARVLGLPVERLNAFLLVLIACTVVLAIQMVGTVLVVSLLVTAASSARMLTSRLLPMMGIASLLGVLGGVLGLFASYILDTPAGATVVLVNTFSFVLVLVFKRLLGTS
ncbi:MAG: metal ABC transporter permease [Deinococcales bacterium]